MSKDNVGVARVASTSGGLPGLRGLDHVGFTVPNLTEAVAFFVEVMGCEPFYELGPFRSDDNWMADHMNVHPRTVMRRLRFLRCGHGSNFEVFEYQSPDQNTVLPKNSDVGASHLGFYVDDISTAADYLRKHGVRILGEPTVRASGPNAGVTWVYFLTPWGMQCELVSFPHGKGYEKETPRRLWETRQPAR
jgi:catechol 2,3-dioxygenase-like lactoylglutathione lyase family enzyme